MRVCRFYKMAGMFAFWTLILTPTLMRSASAQPYGQVRVGMKIGEVISLLGTPGGRVDMEVRRETRLIYPQREFLFVEGRLVDSHARLNSSELPKAVQATKGEERSASELGHGSVDRRSGGKGVKLESVLSEVMKGGSGSSPTETSSRPGVVRAGPLAGSRGMPPAGSMIESPGQYQMGGVAPPIMESPGTIYGREDQILPFESDTDGGGVE